MIDSAYVIAGAVTGFVVGLTGVGGGALMTPILLIFFDVSPLTAIATDLWFAAITKIVAARVHHLSGNIDWQIVKRLWLGSLPMALLIVVVISSGGGIKKMPWLTESIGMVILFTSLGLIVAPRLVIFAQNLRVGNPSVFKAFQPVLTVVSGAILGISVALTSVGAGALGSVILLYLYPFRMSPHKLVATDIVHAVPLAIVAGLGYLFSDTVDYSLLANLLLGSIPAVFLASFFARKISGRYIQIILAVVLFISGIKVLQF